MPEKTLENIVENALRKIFGSVKPSADATTMVDNKLHYDGGALAPTIEPDPIPVHIVHDKPTVIVLRGTKNWVAEKTIIRASGVGITQGAQLLAGMMPYRRSIIIVHKGSRNIAIAPSNSIRFGGTGIMGSFEMAPGDTLTIDTVGEVWAVADPASTGEEINVLQLVEEGAS